MFTILWQAVANVLGTAAAATLMRRAAKRALPRAPELAELSITRESLDYCFVVPPAWREPAASTPEWPPALCELSRELHALLVELTGTVVVNRLAQIPELRELHVVWQRAEGP